MDERFAAFLRVQLGGQWYRASDHLNRHFKFDALFDGGEWTNHGSSCGLSPATD